MKFCPTCETRYDEEILRFCTKDGTPLVDEDQPNFTELPSESVAETPAEDLGEETIIRYNPRKEMLESPPETERTEAPRIVITTTEEKREQNIRARQIPPYQAIPPKQSVGKVVMLTVLGTLAVLAMVLGLFVFVRKDEPTANLNMNVNTNPPPDMNLNNNLNLGGLNYNVPLPTNLNTNLNTNFNGGFNTSLNTNLKTPTPTATPKPSPSATTNINANIGNLNTNNAPPTPRPSVSTTPTPNATPKISPTAPKITPTPLPTGRPANNSNGEN